MIWTVGDRGPNIACSEMKEIAGIDFAPCKGVQNGRVYPTPSYAPSIYRVMLLDNGTFRVTDVITLKDRDGNPLSGMLNPLKTAATENAMDGTGKPLPRELNGFDAEGIVRLADGTFWIGDENGPSIAHFSADGRMIARHVPAGHRRRIRRREIRREGHAAGDPRQARDQPRHRVDGDLAGRALPLFHHAEPARQSRT